MTLVSIAHEAADVGHGRGCPNPTTSSVASPFSATPYLYRHRTPVVLERYFDAGATEIVVSQTGMSSGEDRRRTWRILGELNRSRGDE